MGELPNNKDNNPNTSVRLYDLDNSPIKNIRELMVGHFIELTVPFKPVRKIKPPSYEDDVNEDDAEELAAYYKEMEDDIPTYPAYTVYKVESIELNFQKIYISSAPLFSSSDFIDKPYFDKIIILPARRIGRGNFRSRGYYLGHTYTIGEHATEDLGGRLRNILPQYHDSPLRYKAIAQVDMIMADVERIFDVKQIPGQIFELSLVVKEDLAPSMLGPIYFNFMLNTVRRLMPPQVMVNLNEVYKLYRIQPDRNDPEEDELLVTLAVDFELKEDYHYCGIDGFDWTI